MKKNPNRLVSKIKRALFISFTFGSLWVLVRNLQWGEIVHKAQILILLSGKTLKKQKQIARLLIISGRALFYTMTSPLSQKAMAVEVHR